MKSYQILAVASTSLVLMACTTMGRDSTSVQILSPNASVPDSCQAAGEVLASGIGMAGINAMEAVRIDLRQNAFYRYQANKVRIDRVETADGGLLAQGTAFKCSQTSGNEANGNKD